MTRFKGKPKCLTFGDEDVGWFARKITETRDGKLPKSTGKVIGIDYGLKMMVKPRLKLSISEIKVRKVFIERAKWKNCLRSRKKNEFVKIQIVDESLVRLYRRVATIRKDKIYKVMKWLAKRVQILCIKNLNVRGRTRNQKFSRSIADFDFFKFRRKLEYQIALCKIATPVANYCLQLSRYSSYYCSVKSDRTLLMRNNHLEDHGFEVDKAPDVVRKIKQFSVGSMVLESADERTCLWLNSCVKRFSKSQKPNNIAAEWR
ncbi:MAG: hypothetical protein OXC62_17495 [Aestuariivita sp.]|nr:hypothetical protein [Aestuariivita sp.]